MMQYSSGMAKVACMTTTIADNCIQEVITAPEADQIWGLSSGTVRAACVRRILKRGEECRKSGRDWLVTRAGMVRHYGEPHQPKPAT